MKDLDFSFFVTDGYKEIDINIILISVFIGIIAASIAIVYRRYVLGGIVRVIVDKKAFSEESAITLEDMGYKNNIFVKFALRKSSTFRKTVHGVGEENKDSGIVPRFYIPENIYMREEIKYCKKGTNVFGVFFAAVLFLVIIYLLVNYIPWIIDSLTGLFSSGDI